MFSLNHSNSPDSIPVILHTYTPSFTQSFSFSFVLSCLHLSTCLLFFFFFYLSLFYIYILFSPPIICVTSCKVWFPYHASTLQAYVQHDHFWKIYSMFTATHFGLSETAKLQL